MFVTSLFSRSAQNNVSLLSKKSAELFLFSASAAMLLAFGAGTSAAATCNAAWSANTIYTGGQKASENGVNYTAVYWTRGDDPATTFGPAGSGQPWVSNGACGAGHTVTPPSPVSRIFAPYVDMGTDFGENVEANVQSAGLKAVTLAFLVGPPDGSCSAVWGGYGSVSPSRSLPNDQLWDGVYVQTIVQNLQKSGVQVIVSLGGSSAPDPAYNCSNRGNSVADLQAVYQSVIDRYHVTMLDFDIEAIYWPTEYHPETDQNSITLRDKALVGLKAANPNLVISYTVAVETTGLSDAGKNILQSAKSDGLSLDVLNIMAMDYGRGNDDNGNMGQAAVDAATSTKTNLISAGFSNTTVGIIPMIGANDAQNGYVDTFQLSDVSTIGTFVQGQGASYVSRIGMWSLNRDNDCSTNSAPATSTCSGVSQTRFAFASAFGQLQ